MKTARSALLVLIAISYIFFGCKKDNKGKKPDCRLKIFTETRSGNTATWVLNYNTEGKISSINLTNAGSVTTTEFTYMGNTILSITMSGATIYNRDSTTLDSGGRLLNTRRYFNTAGITWENTAYEYNGDELSKLYITYSAFAPQTKIATYSNGNLITLQSSVGSANTYDYLPEATQVGDYLNLRGFLDYGLIVYPHKNLMKSITNSGSTTTVTYEKNSDGLIVKATVVSPSS
jgi:YD repeat-containing protein